MDQSAASLQAPKVRIEWIDICKSLAIFCMVFLHIGLETPHHCHGLDMFLHYWHMPVFFVLSGLVFSTTKYCGWNNFGKLLAGRIRQLLIPCLFFAFVCLVYNTLYLFPDGVPAKRGTLLQHLLYPNIFLHKFELQWFLLCLFFTEIFYAVIHNLVRGSKWLVAVVSVAILAGGHLLLQKVGSLPFALNSMVYALPMFVLGVLGRKMFLEWRPFEKKWVQILVAIGLVVLTIYHPGKLNVRQCLYDPLWVYPLGIAVTMVVIWLIREQEWWITKLSFYPSVKWLGQNTLAILVMNGSVRKSIPWKYLMVNDNPILVFGVQLVASFIVIYIIYFIVKFIMKYLPWALGKSK